MADLTNDDVYEYLRQKYKRQDDPEYQYRDAQRMGELAAADDRNNLMSALAQSAAQVGSIGGKVADTAPISNLAKGLNATNDKYIAMQSAEDAQRAKRDQMRLDLYEKLRSKADLAAGKKAKYHTVQTDQGIMAVNENDPTDMKLIGKAPPKDKAPKELKWEVVKDQVGPDGQPILYNKETSEFKLGTFPGGTSAKPSNKPATDAQSLAAGFGKRMQGAEDIFTDLQNKGYKPAETGATFRRNLPNKIGGNLFRNSSDQMQEQAERNFVNAVLRRESGAAISPSEFASAEQQYFPRMGDSPEVLAQKKANRLQSIESMKASAGPAWEKTPLIASPNIQIDIPKQPTGTAFGATPQKPAAGPAKKPIDQMSEAEIDAELAALQKGKK